MPISVHCCCHHQAKSYLVKYIHYFQEVALQNHEFNSYYPSQVANQSASRQLESVAQSKDCLVFDCAQLAQLNANESAIGLKEAVLTVLPQSGVLGNSFDKILKDYA